MTPIPKPSLSTPATSGLTSSLVLPTPSTSTSTNSTRQVVERQIAEHEKLLEESNSGIGKNVLIRQIKQLKDKLKEMDHLQQQQQQQKPQLRRQALTSASTSMDDTPPGGLDKLRSLERDVSSYRSPRLLGNHPIPSPSNSGIDSSSLLPLPPPPTGSTPTKRRSKVPNADRRNTDIEFATEIGQGLLLEVRKMQALLQEKEEQLNQLEIQKADMERAAEAMAKQLRQREESEERLKEDTWNLELAKQELTISVTELQQNLHKSSTEQNRLTKQVNDLRSEIEKLRSSEEKLQSIVETMKQRHEQDMSSIRRHAAGLQREKLEQKKHIDTLTSELAIAKAQQRIAKRSFSDIHDSAKNKKTDLLDIGSSGDGSGTDHEGQSSKESPPGSPKQQPTRNQQLEVETLKTSLAHAHRMVSNLRSNLHREKTEKFEFKKLLAESQETIEQLQNEPRMWEDASTRSAADVKRSHKASGGSGNGKRRKGSTRRKRVGSRTPKAGEQQENNDDIEEVVDSFTDVEEESSVSSDEEEMLERRLMQNDISTAGFTSLSTELASTPKEMTLGDQLTMALSSSSPTLSPPQSVPPRSYVDTGTQTELEIDNRQVQTETLEVKSTETRATSPITTDTAIGTMATFPVTTDPATVTTETMTTSYIANDEAITATVPVEQEKNITTTAEIINNGNITVKTSELQRVDMPSMSATPVEQQTQHVQSESVSVPVDAGVTVDIIQSQQPQQLEEVASKKETDTVATQTNSVTIISVATGSDSAIWNDSTPTVKSPSSVTGSTVPAVGTAVTATAATQDLAVGSGAQTTTKVYENSANATVKNDTNQDAAHTMTITPTLDHMSQKQQQQSITRDISTETIPTAPNYAYDMSNQTLEPTEVENKISRDAAHDQQHAGSSMSTWAKEAELAFDSAPSSRFSKSLMSASNNSNNNDIEFSHVSSVQQHVYDTATTTDSTTHMTSAFGEAPTATEYPAQSQYHNGSMQSTPATGNQQSSSVQASNENMYYNENGENKKHNVLSSDDRVSSSQVPIIAKNAVPSDTNNSIVMNNNNNMTADPSNAEHYGDTGRAPQWMANGSLEVPLNTSTSTTTAANSLEANEAFDGQEPKTLTQTEADAMVVRAVEAALNAYRKQEKTATSPQEIRPVHPTIDNDGDIENSSTLGVPLPTAIIVDDTNNNDMNTSENRGSSQVLDGQPPGRPTSQPPSTLLSKAAARSISVASHSKISLLEQPSFSNEEYGTAYVNPHTMTYTSRRRESGSVSSVSTCNTTTDRRPSITSSQLDAAARGANGISDPNAIALITQTMIGDWLYKYTRKTVGNGLSERRHKRFFWIHPYTRTLYWSASAPGVDGRESKAKSAFIEDVSAIPDLTPNPPGLPQVSLLIRTPGRQIKITAPDTSSHNVWYESLSYLLARANDADGTPKKSIDRRDITESVSTSAVSILKKPSFPRLRPVRSISSIAGSTRSISNRSRIEDDDDEGLEDVRMCCNGKHHVSKLEKDNHHHPSPHYRTHTKRSQLSS